MKKEAGLFYPDGSFQTTEDINQRLELETTGFVRQNPQFARPDKYWMERFKERQEQFGQSEQEIKVALPRTSIINFVSDLHVGSPETDYVRLEAELNEIMQTPDSYVVMLGDLIDAFVFNPSQMEDMEQVPEQIALMREIITNLTKSNRLLGIIPGNHEDWQRRSGVNIYELITDTAKVPVQYGVNYLTANVAGIDYKVTMAHCLPGFSMYNPTHPEMREDHFGAEGADIIIAGHTHRRGITRMAKKVHGGGARELFYVSLGSYKATDGWTGKIGKHKLAPEEMGGVAVVLRDDAKQVFTGDILEVNQHFEAYKTL
jgi:UDP-2,3-diacylglucosamine pyrophosphatase LpxH